MIPFTLRHLNKQKNINLMYICMYTEANVNRKIVLKRYQQNSAKLLSRWAYRNHVPFLPHTSLLITSEPGFLEVYILEATHFYISKNNFSILK